MKEELDHTPIPLWGFQGGASGKEPACQFWRLRDTGSIPGSGRSPGERAWLPTLVFLPGESMDRGAWRDTVHEVTKRWTWLKSLSKGAISLIGCPSGCGPNWESPGKIDNMTSFKSHRKMNYPPSPREYSIKSPRLANGSLKQACLIQPDSRTVPM